MKVIIAGSRGWHPPKSDIAKVMLYLNWEVDEVVCGMAPGADMAGKAWADSVEISVLEMPADWNKLKKRAGKIRNHAMALYADAAVVFWDGDSPGSANMVAHMNVLGKKVEVITPDKLEGIARWLASPGLEQEAPEDDELVEEAEEGEIEGDELVEGDAW